MCHKPPINQSIRHRSGWLRQRRGNSWQSGTLRWSRFSRSLNLESGHQKAQPVISAGVRKLSLPTVPTKGELGTAFSCFQSKVWRVLQVAVYQASWKLPWTRISVVTVKFENVSTSRTKFLLCSIWLLDNGGYSFLLFAEMNRLLSKFH